jgi:hypothetical protein
MRLATEDIAGMSAWRALDCFTFLITRRLIRAETTIEPQASKAKAPSVVAIATPSEMERPNVYP